MKAPQRCETSLLLRAIRSQFWHPWWAGTTSLLSKRWCVLVLRVFWWLKDKLGFLSTNKSRWDNIVSLRMMFLTLQAGTFADANVASKAELASSNATTEADASIQELAGSPQSAGGPSAIVRAWFVRNNQSLRSQLTQSSNNLEATHSELVQARQEAEKLRQELTRKQGVLSALEANLQQASHAADNHNAGQTSAQKSNEGPNTSSAAVQGAAPTANLQGTSLLTLVCVVVESCQST